MAAVLVATLITTCVLSAGCIEPQVKGGYGQYAISDDDMRESDGFVMDKNFYHWGDNNWRVKMFTKYPAYHEMLDDERHQLSGDVRCYPSLREAVTAMDKIKTADMEMCVKNDCEFINLTYCDDSHKTLSSEPRTSIYIRHDLIIAHIQAYGYTDGDECEEVVDYYAAILADKLDHAMELER
jgi:hypothetical protein